MMGRILKIVFGDKPWYKSLTTWGLVIIGLAEVFVVGVCGGSGLLTPEQCEPIVKYTQMAGGMMATLGVRKAALR